jgi:hypothetical protein
VLVHSNLGGLNQAHVELVGAFISSSLSLVKICTEEPICSLTGQIYCSKLLVRIRQLRPLDVFRVQLFRVRGGAYGRRMNQISVEIGCN